MERMRPHTVYKSEAQATGLWDTVAGEEAIGVMGAKLAKLHRFFQARVGNA